MGNINACMDSYGSHKMSRARARVCVCVCVCVSERVRIFGCSLKPQCHIPNHPLSAVCNPTLNNRRGVKINGYVWKMTWRYNMTIINMMNVLKAVSLYIYTLFL